MGAGIFLFYPSDTFRLRVFVSDGPVPAAFSGNRPAWLGGAYGVLLDEAASRRSL